MKKNTPILTTSGKVRKKLAPLIGGTPTYFVKSIPGDHQFLREELRVYQSKLEMQKEELRRANEELSQVKKTYEDIYDIAPVAYFTLDKNNLIVMVNIVGAKLLGIERKRLLGKIFSRHISPDRLSRFYYHINQCMKTGVKQTCELKLKSKDENQKFIHLESLAVQDETGNYNQIRMAIIDISDRKKADEKIKALSRELLLSHEHERQMISRELHDSIAQELGAIKIGCDLLMDNHLDVPEDIKNRISQLSKILQKTTMAVRDLSYVLRPPFLEQGDIIKAISIFCNEFSENTGIKVFFFSAGMENISLDDFSIINIYRLIQEGLNNVRKHAEATEIDVTLSYHKPNLLVRIIDDGKGFDVEKRQAAINSEKKMGLRSMQERVRLLSGTMKIASKPNKGTKIFIKLKFRKD